MVVEPAGQGSPSARVLPTVIWFPTARLGTSPAPGKEGFPLLVFSTGYDISVHPYDGLLAAWASAGFVVAAPTYPHNDPSDPSQVDENDIVNHPRDLRSVITAVLNQAGRRTSVLFRLVNSNEVGVVGHSDGAEVSLVVAEGSCCRDPRVKAVAVLSGAELGSFGGRYFGGPAVPILVVQGNADTVNPPACSAQIYNAASRPKYYLDLLGAGHLPPYAGPAVGPNGDRGIVTRVTTDFFDAELAGQPAGVSSMRTDGNIAGTATLTSGASAPAAPGSCPGGG